jgi:hypothetical protein
MKSLLILILLVSFYKEGFGQHFESVEGKGFDSIFQNLKEGFFQGQVSGELRIVNLSGDTVKISFDKENAHLQIQPDPDEVYDVSRKIYSSTGNNEKATFTYTTYAHANAIDMVLNGSNYGVTFIDGGCYSAFKNLKYVYKITGNKELLYLFFTGKIGLCLPRNCGIPQIFIQAGSILVFTFEMPISKKE